QPEAQRSCPLLGQPAMQRAFGPRRKILTPGGPAAHGRRVPVAAVTPALAHGGGGAGAGEGKSDLPRFRMRCMPRNTRRGRPPSEDVLTPSEWRVVHAVQHGLSNREIARRRGISVDAVKYHVANAVAKLGVNN